MLMMQIDCTLLSRLAIISWVIGVGNSARTLIDTSDNNCEEEADVENCKYNVYCKRFDIGRAYYIFQYQRNHEDFFSRHCDIDFVGVQSLYTGNRIYKVDLIFENNIDRRTDTEKIEIYDDENEYENAISSIDLSNENLSYDPLPERTDNLKGLLTLNYSRNAFESIILAGKSDLQALREIDYSHNSINTIEINIDDTYYPYDKLKIINLSHNYLVMLPVAVFEAHPTLEHLDLSYNFIDSLSTLTFEGIKNLLHLNLAHNRISEINLSLIRFTKLEELDLSHNEIENIKFNNFENLSHLKFLDLSFNSILTIEKKSFDNLGALNKLKLNDNKLAHIDKDTFIKLTNLRNIDLSNNNFNNLPQYLFKDKRLSFISVSGNHLEGQIVKGTFDGLTEVTDLDLSNQQLTTIESFGFFGLIQLKTLTLNNNVIHTISKTAFKSLHNLNWLDLSNNQLTNIEFEKDDLVNLQSLMLQNNFLSHVKYEYFNGLNSLQYLDLSSNNITEILPNCFGSLRNLVNFQIANNPLSGSLKQNTFDGLNSLPSLDISGTKISVVENGSFYGMYQLTSLDISHSAIEEMQFNSFTHTGEIESIDLSNNKLETFNVNTSDLSKLNTLILNNNVMKQILSSTFSGLEFLSFINLAHNNITYIDNEAFNDQRSFRFVDVSFNPQMHVNITQLRKASTLSLSGINSDITFNYLRLGTSQVVSLEISSAGIQNLTYLDVKRLNTLNSLVLSKNNIQKVEVGVFTDMKHLTNVDLSFNELDYIQPGAFKDCLMLSTLNISHNYIATISYGVFRGLINLEIVDMSFNNIDSLKSERFFEVPRLNELIADYNHIRDLNLEEFSGTSLSKLSIGGNPIPCDKIVKLTNREPDGEMIEITAATLDEHNGENVFGIRCNMEDSKGPNVYYSQPNNKISDTDKILVDIRNAIYNISTINNSEPNKSDFSNITRQIQITGSELSRVVDNDTAILRGENNKTRQTIEKQNNLLISTLIKENNKTNTILSQIFKSMAAAAPTVVRKPTPIIPTDMQNNSTFDNLIIYINKIKQELEDTMALEKKNMLEQVRQNMLEQMKETRDEIENKITSLRESTSYPSKNSPTSNALTNTDSKPIQGSEAKSFVFIETCVALILILLVGFMLYKFYNSGMFVPRRRTQSTRTLPQDENSTL